MAKGNRRATEIKWMAALDAALKAENDAQQALQKAIDARVRELTLKAQYHAEVGNPRASEAAEVKARVVGRTSAREILKSVTEIGARRRLLSGTK